MKKRMRYLKKCLLFTVIFSFFFSISGAAETADQILQDVLKDQMNKGFQVKVDLDTGSNEKGKANIQVTVLGKINKNNSKLLIFFNEPASSRGMKLLSVNAKGADPLLYIYMPDPGQSFQLSGENLNMRIGDSEATLGDLIPMVAWDGTHTLLGTEKCLQESCYVIETKRDWEKGKRITRIGTGTLLSLSIEHFDDQDHLIKKIETLETRKIGGKNLATSLRITCYRDKESVTNITFLSGIMDMDVPDSLFKPSMLKYSYTDLMGLGEDVL